MFAELAAITSALGAINSAISTFKEAKNNAQDVSGLIGKFGGASERLDDWERKKKLKRPLTAKEAIDLSLARRNVKQTERQLKDLCLMAGAGDVWQEAERLRAQSEREQKEFLRDINVKRRKRKQRIQGIATGVFLVVSLVFIGWGSYVVYDGWQETKRKSAVQKRNEQRRHMRNIRQCGRIEC
jgi:hypothetical protein